MAAETLTFCHYGEGVLVFDEAAGFAWCQSSFDRYVGYLENCAVSPGRPRQATHFVAALGVYAYAEPDLRSSVIDFLPRHCRIVVAERGIVARTTEYARLDSGGFVPLACLSDAPPRSPDLAGAAALYLGCPYLWGGRSFHGIDCSGLVQSAFRDLGITVPRDTDMQRDAVGEPLAVADPAALRRGDLLYLPGHVMIHAGEGAVIHADGVMMTVRRDNLADLIARRGLSFTEFVVRRYPGAGVAS
jgi:cell wall-associated NlpC family hydrolase